MIKMIIKMDEGKIASAKEFPMEHVYSVLDNVFGQYGYQVEQIEGNREYRGNGDPRDFGRFGRIYNGLKKQPWFVKYVSTWLLCNSDDVEDPKDFSVEDLLNYDKSRITGGV